MFLVISEAVCNKVIVIGTSPLIISEILSAVEVISDAGNLIVISSVIDEKVFVISVLLLPSFTVILSIL